MARGIRENSPLIRSDCFFVQPHSLLNLNQPVLLLFSLLLFDMTSILNILGFRQRDADIDGDIENADSDGANNATTALLLPFETKASAIREDVEKISAILDEIPITTTTADDTAIDESQHDVYAESLLRVENKLHEMQKDIVKLQKQNNRFAKTYWVRYPSMVRMQNGRFADTVQQVRRVTDTTSEVHQKYQAMRKEALHFQCTKMFPGASDDDIKAFVEGWRHGDKLLENDKYNYTTDNNQSISVSSAEKKKLKTRRDKIQSMSRKLLQLYDIMHDLSKVLSEHEEMAEKVERNIEESLFTLKDAEGNAEERSYMQKISRENKIAIGLTFAMVVLWFMMKELGIL